MSDGPVQLEENALDQLRELGGDDFLGELVDTFLDEAPGLLAALHAALEKGDAVELRRAAHTLKSNGATFGALAFSEACRELEELAKSGDLSGAAPLVERVESAYTPFEQALEPLREEAPS